MGTAMHSMVLVVLFVAYETVRDHMSDLLTEE
jgi:hypothetical protein